MLVHVVGIGQVEYEGEKYLGILYSLDAYGMASIKCPVYISPRLEA